MRKIVFSDKKNSIIEDVWIGDNCEILNFCILKNMKIGNNCKLFPHAKVYNGPVIGDNVIIGPSVNIYGEKVKIENKVKIGAFVEIQPNVTVGEGSIIGSHSFICSKVNIGKNSFIGHGVMTINDKYPKVGNSKLKEETELEWEMRVNLSSIIISDDVNIGTGAILMSGIEIGRGATVGAGSLVLESIPPGETWVGNPARKIR